MANHHQQCAFALPSGPLDPALMLPPSGTNTHQGWEMEAPSPAPLPPGPGNGHVGMASTTETLAFGSYDASFPPPPPVSSADPWLPSGNFGPAGAHHAAHRAVHHGPGPALVDTRAPQPFGDFTGSVGTRLDVPLDVDGAARGHAAHQPAAGNFSGQLPGGSAPVVLPDPSFQGQYQSYVEDDRVWQDVVLPGGGLAIGQHRGAGQGHMGGGVPAHGSSNHTMVEHHPQHPAKRRRLGQASAVDHSLWPAGHHQPGDAAPIDSIAWPIGRHHHHQGDAPPPPTPHRQRVDVSSVDHVGPATPAATTTRPTPPAPTRRGNRAKKAKQAPDNFRTHLHDESGNVKRGVENSAKPVEKRAKYTSAEKLPACNFDQVTFAEVASPASWRGGK